MQQYDLNDEYLMLKEFSAHILQQPASQAAHYFGVNLPSRIGGIQRRRTDLPAVAAIFTREVEVFSAYAERRWGLAAGRVHLVTIRPK
jgi:hypothetical protein